MGIQNWHYYQLCVYVKKSNGIEDKIYLVKQISVALNRIQNPKKVEFLVGRTVFGLRDDITRDFPFLVGCDKNTPQI